MVDGYMKLKGLWCVGGVSQQKHNGGWVYEI